MNILIINGSPRIHGNISAMLDAIREEAEQRGAEVTTVLASRLQVKPCTGCMTCRETHHCVLPEDDAQCVLAAIKSCDVLVVGAPCYWGNMPGQLKIIFDRIVVPPCYRNICVPVGGYCAFEGNACQWGVMALDGKVVVEARYQKVEIEKDGTVHLTIIPGKVKTINL